MLLGLIELVFGIIKAIWYAPVWLVILVVIILAVINMLQSLFDGSDSDNTRSSSYGGGLNNTSDTGIQSISDKIEQPFVFYDYNGDRCGRGDCFYDSEGNCVSWGDGFYDGKGYYRNWGDNYYDSRGYFRHWGSCFYDTKGNLVYPNDDNNDEF